MNASLRTDVMVPMSDGTKLATDVWLPESDEPVPALLARTPYGKQDLLTAFSLSNPLIFSMLDAGYAVALQDGRGTGKSEGTFTPYVDEGGDGADTVKWIAAQQWCDGNVGTFGLSYLGMNQWPTAATGVAALKAIAPSFGPADQYTVRYSRGGAMALGQVLPWYTILAAIRLMRDRPDAAPEDLATLMRLAASGAEAGRGEPGELYAATPVQDKDLIFKYMPLLRELFEHPARDDFWKDLDSLERIDHITAPALIITGWFDRFCTQNTIEYARTRRRAPTAEARDGQRLIIGPWAHDPRGFEASWPDRSFPSGNVQAANLTQAQIAFFDRHVKGETAALDAMAPVRIYVMGIDEWRDEQDWPLPDTRYVEYHLGGDGPANTAVGAGTLSASPATHDRTDTYLYDPSRPVPTLTGAIAGALAPMDQSPIERRADVLCFTTPVLQRPVEVTGPISLTLFVSSSAVDTDFTAQLTDVHPDGRSLLLSEGIQRVRYRESLEHPKPMTPGEVYEITFDVGVTSNVFLPGHRIRLAISSSNFPRYDRNSNTGGTNSAEREEDMVTAINDLHRGPRHPSRLTLPIIER